GNAFYSDWPLNPPLEAPLTGRMCIHYFFMIEEQSSSGWRQVAYEERGQDFVIEDDTGRAFIYMDESTVAMHRKIVDHADILNSPPPRVKELMVKYDLHRIDQLRFTERTLAKGDLVAVLGIAKWEQRPLNQDSAPEKMLGLHQTADGPAIVSDER